MPTVPSSEHQHFKDEATSHESFQSIAHELEAAQRRADALFDEWQTLT